MAQPEMSDIRTPGPPSPAGLFDGLIFKVATGAQRIEALKARCDVYATDWPDIPQDKVIDAADDAASHLIACTDTGEIIASLRILAPDQRPFDMERFISIEPLLPKGSSPAEIGRLIVKHDHRHVRSHSFVQLGIFKLAIDLSLRLGITDLILTALPLLRHLYRLAGFIDTGLTFHHSTWGPVHVMRLDVTKINSPNSRNTIARLLTSSSPPNFILK